MSLLAGLQTPSGAAGPREPREEGAKAAARAPTACRHVKKDGTPCRVRPSLVRPSGWCWFHDPANKEGRREARQRGGRRRKKGIDPEDLGPLCTPQDAERWCVVAARAVAIGQITPAAGNTIRGLVGQFLEAQEKGWVRARLEELTARVERLHSS